MGTPTSFGAIYPFDVPVSPSPSSKYQHACNMDDNWMRKPSVAAALKGLDETDTTKFITGVQKWRNMFAKPKWQAVIANMHDIVDENHTKDVEEPSPLPASPTILRRHNRPLHLARVHTAGILRAPSTARKQRKLLGATGRSFTEPPPTGNSFAAGGFWDKSSPNTPTTRTPRTPRTPRTSRPASWSPITLRDSQSKAIYSDVKMSIDKMALKVCASRLNLPVNKNGQAVFHASLVTSKDELCAAEIVVHAQKILSKPHFDAQLPKRLQEYAATESTLHENHQITGTESRLSSHLWRHIDADTGEMTYIVDQHRQLLQMNRHRRKSRDLDMSSEGIRLAWAVRILEDIQCRVQYEEEHESADSEEEERDFDYATLVKDIKRQFSEPSALATMVAERISADSSPTPSVEPIAPIPEFYKSGTSLKDRLRNKLEPRPAGAAPCNGAQRRVPRALNFRTSSDCEDGKNNAAIPKSRAIQPSSDDLASPEEKEFRRRGISHVDLQRWSDELEKMEGAAHVKPNSTEDSPSPAMHPALRSTRSTSAESSKDLIMIAPKYDRTETTSAARQARSAAGLRPTMSLETARALKVGVQRVDASPTKSKLSRSSTTAGKRADQNFSGFQFPIRRNSSSEQHSPESEGSSASDRARTWSRQLAKMEGKEDERRLSEREM